MTKRLVILFLFFAPLLAPYSASANVMKPGEFLVLCYHAVPVEASPDDPLSIPQKLFVEQMEYLKTHGYRPVSLDDIVRAGEGKSELPEKPVLLTFDDGYVSYYEFVAPLLREYGYPSVVAIVGRFIDNPPDDSTEPFMSWKQIREVSRSELVEVVSHTYGLHTSIPYTPQGNVGPAALVRAFHGDTATYESEDEYRARLSADFRTQKKLFRRKLGLTPRGIVWPYGKLTQVGEEVARKHGYRVSFSLEDGFAQVDRLFSVNRYLIYNEPMSDFIVLLKGEQETPPVRAVQVDLDLIYVPGSSEKTVRNLDRLIDRLVAMKVNTVFLQAFADPDGSGTIRSVYFPNSLLPVRADIFGHAAHQIGIRDMKVYAWMPTLSIEFPDNEHNERLRVRERSPDGIRPSQSWYERLSPFDKEVKGLVRSLYEELAAHSRIDGVLFQDDAYLTGNEDFHPSALAAFRERFGAPPMEDEIDTERALRWTRHKTEALIDFTENLMEGVRRYAPGARFARNIYAILLTHPESENSFAQNYERFLQTYDLVVVMAYPQMEKVNRASRWLEGLVLTAKETRDGIEKSVFKVQTYDWKRETWLGDTVVLKEIRDLLSSGARHVAYYPDNPLLDKPALRTITLEMSTESYPFMP
ncbi:MAG: poly-beta-1,6-N-acetyl-D-glucosamine N-deacetylase PgaB [Thermodesulfobacteriota bacterium]